MQKKEIEKVYIGKINQLKKYDKAYFEHDSPLISDKDYDSIKEEILDPDAENTENKLEMKENGEGSLGTPPAGKEREVLENEAPANEVHTPETDIEEIPEPDSDGPEKTVKAEKNLEGPSDATFKDGVRESNESETPANKAPAPEPEPKETPDLDLLQPVPDPGIHPGDRQDCFQALACPPARVLHLCFQGIQDCAKNDAHLPKHRWIPLARSSDHTGHRQKIGKSNPQQQPACVRRTAL